MAKCLMVQGTSSDAGKSLLVTALCRIYAKRGYKVAPFKSQNMSLNSYTTEEDGEIAIAQVLQANAANVEPSIHMNPILLKPKGEFTSQVIVHGKAVGDMDFREYQTKYRQKALEAIKESLDILKEENDLIFIEGAGSPAEINLRDKDIANMKIAEIADAPVLLVADIYKGGVFAQIAGTIMLLEKSQQDRIKGTVINKFIGNADILIPGIKEIEEITSTPVLGILPYDNNLKLPEEDSASLMNHKFNAGKDITIGVIKLPKIANFTDIDPFEYEEDVGLRMIEIFDDIDCENPDIDALILPGTRSATGDMKALKDSGMDLKIKKLSEKIPIIGICGGYQILGRTIIDEENKESSVGTIEGLGLLDVFSEFKRDEKVVKQSIAKIDLNKNKDSESSDDLIYDIFKNIDGEEITGFELHEGTTQLNSASPLFKVEKGIGNNDEDSYDGAYAGNIFGSYFHGLFYNYNIRREFLNHIRREKGLKEYNGEDPYQATKDYSIEKLANIVEENLDMDYIDSLLFDK